MWRTVRSNQQILDYKPNAFPTELGGLVDMSSGI